jgi:type I restriction enzyme S subunit
LRSGNIKGNTFDLEDIVRISKKINPLKFVHENEILMCNRNGSARLVGKVAKIPKLQENMSFGTFMTIVRSNMYEYLYAYFQTDAFREQIRFSTAVAINQISLPLLASVKLPVPPLSLQQSFAAKIESIEKQKAAISQSIAETRKLFDYTMDKYFG